MLEAQIAERKEQIEEKQFVLNQLNAKLATLNQAVKGTRQELDKTRVRARYYLAGLCLHQTHLCLVLCAHA